MPSTTTCRTLLVSLLLVLSVTVGVVAPAGAASTVSPTDPHSAFEPSPTAGATDATVASSCVAGDSGPPATQLGLPVDARQTTSVGSTPVRPTVVNETRDTTIADGDVAVVPLSLPADENATVTIVEQTDNRTRSNGTTADGGNQTEQPTEPRYVGRFRVHDDGDGRTTLLVNSYRAGGRDPDDLGDHLDTVAPNAYTVDETDTLDRSVGNDSAEIGFRLPANTTATFDAGRYTVTVTADGRVVDSHTVTVTPSNVGNATLLRARPSLFETATVSSLRPGESDGHLAPLAAGEYDDRAVVRGETLLIRLAAPSLLGVVAAQNGSTPTERFIALHEERASSTPVTVEIFGPCGGIQLVETAAEGGLRVVTDYQTGVVTLLFDTERLAGLDAGGQGFFINAERDSRLARQLSGLTGEFHVGDRETTVDGSAIRSLPASENATVSGTTRLLPGSRVTLHLSSRVDAGRDWTATGRVGPNGNFSVAVDLSNASTPNLFVGRVAGTRFTAIAGEPDPVRQTPFVDTTVANWEWYVSGSTDTGRELRLREYPYAADFLVVYEFDPEQKTYHGVGSVTSDEDAIAVDSDESPRWFLAVAHRDGDGDGEFDGPATDPPYRVNGSAVADWVASTTRELDTPETAPPPLNETGVSLPSWMRDDPETETPTPTPTTTESPTPPTTTDSPTPPAATDSPTPTPASHTPTQTRSGGQTAARGQTTTGTPGFGTLAAVTALVALALVAATRRRGR